MFKSTNWNPQDATVIKPWGRAMDDKPASVLDASADVTPKQQSEKKSATQEWKAPNWNSTFKTQP